MASYEQKRKKVLERANKARKSLSKEQLEAIDQAHETLRDCLQMLYDCQDLYLSDVRKLDTAYYSLKNEFNLDNEQD